MIIIGGKGYRWRGKLIRTITRNNIICVSMPRKESVIIAPCSIIPDFQYKVTITAFKNSGNGAILVNFFGSERYDGTPVSVNIQNAEQKSYTVYVKSPKSFGPVQMYFRVWRPNDATGTVFVKDIQISKQENKIIDFE
jgi:hypothetical protein